MVRSQLLGQAGGFFCRQSSHRPQVRELWEVGRDIIQRRHSVSPPGRNFLSVYHKKSRCNTRRCFLHYDACSTSTLGLSGSSRYSNSQCWYWHTRFYRKHHSSSMAQGLESNFTAVFHLTQALLPVIPSGGSIITIGSSIVAHPLPNMAAYGAGKAGSAYFTQVLAQELGPRGIRANIVSPGSIDTGFGGPGSEAFKQQIVARTALRRIGQPDDVATVVLFLSSDLARFISGQNIFVDGGVL